MKFSAATFYALAHSFGGLECQFWAIKEKNPGKQHGDVPEQFAKFFRENGDRCTEIGLRQSHKAAYRAAHDVLSQRTAEAIHRNLKCVSELVNSEMEDGIFLYVRPESQELYDQKKPPFGEAVERKFNDAFYDISEAAKCLALERWTASVLHLMRVLEIGLRRLADSLKVKLVEPDMQKLLGAMQKEWKRIEGLKKKPKNWKAQRQFYSEAFLEFGYLKDAWRNYASHGKDTYDEERASSIFNHVKSLMQHLAKRL